MDLPHISFDTAIVGLQHHEGWLCVGNESRVVLVHEKHNPHDENAVAVYPTSRYNSEIVMDDKRVGYIPRAIAAVLCRYIPEDISDHVAREAHENSVKCSITARVIGDHRENKDKVTREKRIHIPITISITCADAEVHKTVQDGVVRVLAQEKQRKIDDDFRRSARKAFGYHHTDEELDKLIANSMGAK